MARNPLFETHIHTPLCGHATGELEEYAAAAEQRFLSGITVTCHNPLPDGVWAAVRMAPEQFNTYLALVDRAKCIWKGRIDVRLGLECDFIPGYGHERWLEKQVVAAPFDYLLGSIHPQCREYQKRHQGGEPIDFQKTYFNHLVDTAELGLFDCLAHPDLVKNVMPNDWHLEPLLDHIKRCLDRIATTGIAMELNTSGWNKSVPEQNPASLILREMALRDIPVVVGSDAHQPDRVGDRFLEAFALLERAGYAQISHFLERRRHNVPIAEARRNLMFPPNPA